MQQIEIKSKMQIDKKSLITIANFSKEKHHIKPIFFHTEVL